MGLQRLFRIVLTVITLSTGIIVLLSFIVDSPSLRSFRGVLAEWALIVVAFALILGVFNVLNVHLRRIKGRNAIYSLTLIGAFLVVFIPGITSAGLVPTEWARFVGPNGVIVSSIYRYVQRPVQATLFSLMAFFVATAAWRAFRIHSAASLVMFISAVLVLLGSVYLDIGVWDTVVEIKNWVLAVPVMAGTRGILLGIALGTIVTGIRFLLGVERPYSD